MKDWNYYSETYDLMASVTPAYRDLLNDFNNEVRKWTFPNSAKILEVGAGTGNFSIEAAKAFPNATIIHSEPEPGMQQRAIDKAKRDGFSNIQFAPLCADGLAFKEGELDAVIMVHVLYTLPDPVTFLKKLFPWLRKGAFVFACDAGRVIDISDWKRYLWHELIRERGYFRALRTMWMARGIFKSNGKIADAQKSGQYWLHSGEEFARAFLDAGFSVERQDTVYRGYSDLVIARKPF